MMINQTTIATSTTATTTNMVGTVWQQQSYFYYAYPIQNNDEHLNSKLNWGIEWYG